MVRKKKAASAGAEAQRPLNDHVVSALEWLEKNSFQRTLAEMGPKYGIHAKKAFGVTMANMKVLAKQLGQSHELAAALWDTEWYEARMVASMVEEPDAVTPAQMDRWAKDFDNWGICDTVCFVLFDRTPHAFGKVAKWSDRREEFVKRAAFAVLWGLTVHDKRDCDEAFFECLPLVERAAADERHFVKKAVNMALRAVGKRNLSLNAAAVEVAQRLAASDDAASRWVGKDAVRELTSPKIKAWLARRAK